MTLAYTFGILAGLFSVVAYIPYCYAIWHSKKKNDGTDPKLSTWIIWSISSALLFATYFALGDPEVIYLSGAYCVGTVAVLIVCALKKVRGWSTFDTVCIIASIISVFLWWYFKSAFVALVINLIIDVIGGLPTLKSAVTHPDKENKPAWKLWWIGTLLNMVTVILIRDYGVEKMLYPIVIFVMVSTISYFVFMRKNKSHISHH